LLREYLTPHVDENAAQFMGSSTYYYLHDGLGSVSNITDGNESVTHHYTYRAFGKSNDKGESSSPLNRYQYTSRRWDPETATYFYRTRQYDPGNGRFTARDSIAYTNSYTYVGSLPTMFVDPAGQEEEGTGSLLGYFIRLIPKEVGLFSADTRLFPPIPVGPATVEVIGFVNASVYKCCREKNEVRWFATGTFGIEVSGGVGLSIGGNSQVTMDEAHTPGGKRGHYHEYSTTHRKGKRGAVTCPSLPRRAKEKGVIGALKDPTVTRGSSGGGFVKQSLPPCPESVVDLEILVGASGFISIGWGSWSIGLAFDMPIGKASIEEGFTWAWNPSGGVVTGMGSGARVQVYGRGQTEGHLDITEAMIAVGEHLKKIGSAESDIPYSPTYYPKTREEVDKLKELPQMNQEKPGDIFKKGGMVIGV
jgi:RHS repeat-associated protein